MLPSIDDDDRMTLATPSELLNFYRHCDIAARLLTEVPANVVTHSHTLAAVQKATLCWTGRKGIVQASERALEERLGARTWRKGFVREHVIPVSVVHRKVIDALSAGSGDDLKGGWQLINDDMAAHGVASSAIKSHQMHHRTIEVARAVREWTELAWVTKHDHDALRLAKLVKSMPADWDLRERQARYRQCGITLVPVPVHLRG